MNRYIVTTNIKMQLKSVYAPCTNIRITPLNQQRIPNQFYFAVADGIIKPEEVPPYAGLFVFKKGKLIKHKTAPYLHKTKMDLDKILLSKFYALWHFKQSNESEIEAQQTADQ